MTDQLATGLGVLGQELDQHRITGTVVHAAKRGLNPHLNVPLISHVHEGLWQGGCIDGVRLSDDFDFVLSLYPWEQYVVGPTTEVQEVRMYDALDQDTEQVAALAADLAERVEEGQKVLVHCQAGLNRSGLVAARALTFLGFTGVEAISLLRSQRSPLVLCNETFENYIAGIA